MKTKTAFILLVVCITMLALHSVAETPLQPFTGTRFGTLTQFGGPEGSGTWVRLAADGTGAMYGTTANGGDFAAGDVFRLAPPTNPGAAWKYSRIHSFKGGTDGADPQTGVTVDVNGNLYGTTYDGGTANQGTVYMLTPPGTQGGVWTETVLYSFLAGNDGQHPFGGVVFDAAGNLYGATQQGGPYICSDRKLKCGTIFQLSPGVAGGPWTETVLYNFQGRADGAFPDATLTIDSKGNLYGTTSFGGGTNPLLGGMVFQLAPNPSGVWTFTTVYDFQGSGQPSFEGDLVVDGKGVLYGTSWKGGLGEGFVFRLGPPAVQGGAWRFSNLWSFSGSDGSQPQGGVIPGPKGVLYGTTYSGGDLTNCNFIGCGVVFQLTPPVAGGKWSYTSLYTFAGGMDGAAPQGALLRNKAGILFGTTSAGGKLGGGTVFQVK
jgi:uncharacterized repeat protein (TIGR03803 family)